MAGVTIKNTMPVPLYARHTADFVIGGPYITEIQPGEQIHIMIGDEPYLPKNPRYWLDTDRDRLLNQTEQ